MPEQTTTTTTGNNNNNNPNSRKRGVPEKNGNSSNTTPPPAHVGAGPPAAKMASGKDLKAKPPANALSNPANSFSDDDDNEGRKNVKKVKTSSSSNSSIPLHQAASELTPWVSKVQVSSPPRQGKGDDGSMDEVSLTPSPTKVGKASPSTSASLMALPLSLPTPKKLDATSPTDEVAKSSQPQPSKPGFLSFSNAKGFTQFSTSPSPSPTNATTSTSAAPSATIKQGFGSGSPLLSKPSSFGSGGGIGSGNSFGSGKGPFGTGGGTSSFSFSSSSSATNTTSSFFKAGGGGTSGGGGTFGGGGSLHSLGGGGNSSLSGFIGVSGKGKEVGKKKGKEEEGDEKEGEEEEEEEDDEEGDEDEEDEKSNIKEGERNESYSPKSSKFQLQNTFTGEENESVLTHIRAKLFCFTPQVSGGSEWKERGVGNIKLLQGKDRRFRLVMRTSDTMRKLILNVRITATTPLKHEGKQISFSALEAGPDGGSGGGVKNFSMRCKDDKLAGEWFGKVRAVLDAPDEPLEKEEDDG